MTILVRKQVKWCQHPFQEGLGRVRGYLKSQVVYYFSTHWHFHHTNVFLFWCRVLYDGIQCIFKATHCIRIESRRHGRMFFMAWIFFVPCFYWFIVALQSLLAEYSVHNSVHPAVNYTRKTMADMGNCVKKITFH